MRYLTQSAIILALCCGQLCPQLGQAASFITQQSSAPRKSVGATVSGRITVQGKGKGGIVVGLRARDAGPQDGPGHKGVSDAEGNYQITDIPAGNYLVSPLSPAYVVSDFTSFGGPGKSLLLTEGERVNDIDFSIVRGGVVTGRVTNADGTPAIEESVYLVPADQANDSARRFSGSAAAQTDDRGVYRMYGLRAGRFKVAVGMAEEGLSSSRTRPTFQRVFYPDVTEFNEAKVVEITEGSESTNIDIVLGQTIKGFAASGIIVDGETTQPVPSLRVGLQKIIGTNQPPFIGTSSMSNARGEFRLENVTPGKYSLFVMPQANTDTLIQPIQIEVVDQDVKGLTLKTAKGAVISGVVVIEGTQDPRLYEKLRNQRLYAFVRNPDNVSSFGSSRVVPIDPDGSFRIGGLLPGTAMFNLTSADRTRTGFVISRIEREGAVQSRNGMEIKAREQVTGVKIVVVHGSGTIRGSVKWDGDLPPAGVRLMVRLTSAGDTAAPFRPEEVDARGRFIFQGVPAGDYEVILSSTVRVGNAPLASRQSVTVTDGATTEIELVVDTGAKKNPTP
ncbi:MAG TPA: hypothetical protein VJU86_17905 [Pyrinomonadaceae bacterium]|nr:hypothetical protein [Pyrinomonadaceae bacterium]